MIVPRKLLAILTAGFTTLAALQPVSTIAAPVAQQQTQVPGYYRMNLGEYQITALYDGYTALPITLLHGISAQDAQQLIEKMFIANHNGVQTAVNGYLINTGKNLVLIDVGTADCFGPTLGRIPQNLLAAGYQPEQVDTILLTHLHGDHVCGLTQKGKAQFPNATVYVAKPEADFWLDKKQLSKAPEDVKPYLKMAQDAVAPYQKTNKLKTYQPGDKLAGVIEIVPTPGHTPGHTSYLLGSQGQQMLIWGDIVHSHAIQFTHPEVSMEFDVDPKQAIETRKKIFQRAADQQLWIGGAHLPFPGMGHVRAKKQGYRWVPIEYGPVKGDDK